MKSVAALFTLVLSASLAVAQAKKTENTLVLDDPTKPGTGTLADCSWFTGYWVGSGLGGTCEEVWMPPLAGSQEMMGSFRYVKDGKLMFTEHFMLVPEKDSLTLKLKHFDGTFKGWEAQDKCVEFKLVKVEKDAIYFSGMTMKKSKDGLDIYVAISNRKDGSVREEKFAFKAGKLGN